MINIILVILCVISFSIHAKESYKVDYADCTNETVTERYELAKVDSKTVKSVVKILKNDRAWLNIPNQTFDSLFVGPTGLMHIIHSNMGENLSTSIMPLSSISLNARKLNEQKLKCLLAATLVEYFYIKEKKESRYSYYLIDGYYVLKLESQGKVKCTDYLMKPIKNNVMLISRVYPCDTEYADLRIFLGSDYKINSLGSVDVSLLGYSNLSLAKKQLAMIGVKKVEVESHK